MSNETFIKGYFPGTAMPDPYWWEALWPRPLQTLAALGVRAEMEVVDLCCGDGLFTAPLALMTRRVIGIDIDPSMLDLARARIVAAGATNYALVEGAAYAVAEILRWPTDFVLMANTFHGVPDKTRLASAITTILKAHALFAVVNWHHRRREETHILRLPRGPRTEMRMEPAEVAAIVKSAGLQLARTVELPPYHYGVIFKKPAG